jgi:nucleoside-diphosphate-sugar epimerase
MAHKTKNILIFGATGLIGEHITRSILDNSSDFGTIAVFTSRETATSKADKIDALKSRRADIIIGNFTSDDDLNAAFDRGFDTIVSCLGRPVLQHQLKIIELADKHPKVKRIFPSEYGTDIEYGPQSKDEPPHQQKWKVRAALKNIKDLEYTYVVTGPYGDAGGLFLGASAVDNEATGTFDVKRKRAVLLGDGSGRVSLTTMRDVGKLVVAALKHPEETKNRALRVNSFTATPKEIVAEYEKQTGDKWDVSYTSLDELKKLEKQAYADGVPRAHGLTLRRIWTEGGTLYEERDNDAIGMEDGIDSLESAVRQAIEVQTR